MILIGALSICAIIGIYLIATVGLLTEIQLSTLLVDLNQAYLYKIIKFSFIQASLSTLISIGLAIPVARALHRQQFPGKSALLLLSGLSFVLPVIVVILGLAAVHGNSGWISHLVGTLNIKPNYLYGLTGILIAHVFFNLPLASRILLLCLNTIPSSSWRLVNHLGLNSWQIYRFLEWPLMKSQLPALAGLIFLLCFTSFAIVLVFGGGLKYSTLEVAIYQAIRFDFDIAKAVVLAGLQISICALVFFLIVKNSSEFSLQNLSAKPVVRIDGKNSVSILFDTLILAMFSLWIVLPLIAIVLGGLNLSAWSITLSPGFLLSVKGSLLVSMSSAAIAVIMVLSLCYFYKFISDSKPKAHSLDLLIQLILIFPPFVLATGLFIILKGNIKFSGPLIVILINVLAILPFMMRIMLPAIVFTKRYDPLCASLGIMSIERLKKIDWPIIKNSCALALGIGLALSLGDFSVIALFGSQDFQTLPLYLYRLMGAYRMEQAGVIAVIICLVSVTAFILSQLLIGTRDVKAR